MELESQVAAHYGEMTAVERTIWQYIKANPDQCRTASISQVARACHVAPTSITRFTHRIGLSGYAELKMALKWQMESEKAPPDPFALDRCLQDYRLTLDALETRDYADYLAVLDQTQRLFAFGTGEVQRHAAREIKRLFMFCQRSVFVAEGMTELSAIAPHIGTGDAIFVFSMSGNNPAANALLARLKAQGCRLITVTSYEDNALSHLSDAHFGFYNHKVINGNGTRPDAHLSAPFFLISEILFVKYHEHQKTLG